MSMAKWDAKKKPCLLQSLPAQQGIRFLLLICPNMESARAAAVGGGSRVGSGLFLCCRALEECFAAGYKYWSLVFHVGLTGKAFAGCSFALTSGRYGRSYHQYDAVGKCE